MLNSHANIKLNKGIYFPKISESFMMTWFLSLSLTLRLSLRTAERNLYWFWIVKKQKSSRSEAKIKPNSFVFWTYLFSKMTFFMVFPVSFRQSYVLLVLRKHDIYCFSNKEMPAHLFFVWRIDGKLNRELSCWKKKKI